MKKNKHLKINFMSEKEEIKKEIEILENQIKPLKEKLEAIRKKEGNWITGRLQDCWKGVGHFNENELLFSATAKCVCGGGLAYPTNQYNISGYWDCANVLTGNADFKKKHDRFPFAFYAIKSEMQPSANGATTRPIEK